MNLFNNLEPKSINELLDKQFFIPHYQRGYRWTNQQVEQLLDDIDTFSPREILGSENKTFYCIQPVVVKFMDENIKNNNNLIGDWYEVIDGQQRITTIFLIIQYINDLWAGRQKKQQFKLDFETRNNCMKFLSDIKVKEDNLTVDINKENIDFYYISCAYQKIRDWEINYEGKKGKKLDDAEFQSKLLAHSKIIWYQVSEQQDSRALFERLNLGKIPLTNAELIKALFLSSESFKELTLEERKLKQYDIARLWDEIEHQLNNPDMKLWFFITNKKPQQYETKIELILDMISGKNDEQKDPLFTFLKFTEKQKSCNLSEVWNEIEQFYFTIYDWYLDKEYYHKIGYLIAAKHFVEYRGVDLGRLVKETIINKKSDFIKKIDILIKDSVKVELSELRYESHYNQIFNVLLLFNVETIRSSISITDYYPFKQHKDNIWSLEHIHARSSENFDKTKKEPWQKWLDLHQEILEELILSKSENFLKKEIILLAQKIKQRNNDQLTWERFNELFQA
ncbi:DUF262 domain-containing protein, partial [Chryseobacterium aquaticum]|uniref:DUF262 domain-containing protein n=1 Tax=Chryseobacterium aquaticum TaxID=452084 RepID=UPI002FC5D358